MIVCRVAEMERDHDRIMALLVETNQKPEAIPDIVFLCEDTEDDRLMAVAGLFLPTEYGLPVLGGWVVPTDVYEDKELRRALAEDFRRFTWGWLKEHDITTVIGSVSRRNTRALRWFMRHGAKRYARKHGCIWFVLPITENEEHVELPGVGVVPQSWMSGEAANG